MIKPKDKEEQQSKNLQEEKKVMQTVKIETKPQSP